MNDILYRYYGPVFNDQKLNPEKYKEEYFEKELEMESNLFFDLRKQNEIKPYRIIDSSENEKKEIKDFFNNNRDSFFFIFDDKNIIGSILILGNYIQCLCVNKQYQRQGYGERLVKYAVNYIKQKKHEYVELNIMNGNTAAETLYTKIGFTRIN